MLLRQPLSVVNLSVVEGKYRMVRRILHNCGHSVVSLHRTRYGGIHLTSAAAAAEGHDEDEDEEGGGELVKEELPESAVRYLTSSEKKWLQKLMKSKLKM